MSSDQEGRMEPLIWWKALEAQRHGESWWVSRLSLLLDETEGVNEESLEVAFET